MTEFSSSIYFVILLILEQCGSVGPMTLLAPRVHLLTNNWADATDAADMVLSMDKKMH